MSLGDEKYLLFTTYRKSGEAVSSPVWVVTLDSGELAFWTSSGSGKAKRLAHTAKVTLQPSDARGKVKEGSAVTSGQARLVSAGDPLFTETQQKVKAKYGFMTHITKALGTVGGVVKRNRIPYGDRAVVIALD
jgi:uncharacterized protein